MGAAQKINSPKRAGAFAFWWQAHDHHYGIPVSTNDDLHAGRCVVCNGSRATVPSLRTRYANLHVALITAPVGVLEERINGRGRTTDGSTAVRLARNDKFKLLDSVDSMIDNSGMLADAVEHFVTIIKALTTKTA